MRMTERRLRRLIRKLIIENVINQNKYTFKFGDNWEVKKVRELDGAKIVSVKESSDQEDVILLLVNIPSENGDMGVILFDMNDGKYEQSVDDPYLEDGAATGEIVPKPFAYVKEEFERQTKGDELFKSVRKI